MKNLFYILLLAITGSQASGQTDTAIKLPVKISHAEPLYIDLIRDLGARKGEKEWNAGWGTGRQNGYAAHSGFVEYEFSPMNRLGLEAEIPFTFYRPEPAGKQENMPKSRIEALKLAAQYTFLVSEKHQMSMAAAYIHEFNIHSFQSMGERGALVKGNGSSPVLLVAKRWGKQMHSLLYTGPEWKYAFGSGYPELSYLINTAFHYVLPQSRNFIGLEISQEIENHQYLLNVRPQMKLAINSALALGMVTDIPVHAENKGISILFRLIYEPAKKK